MKWRNNLCSISVRKEYEKLLDEALSKYPWIAERFSYMFDGEERGQKTNADPLRITAMIEHALQKIDKGEDSEIWATVLNYYNYGTKEIDMLRDMVLKNKRAELHSVQTEQQIK